MKSDFLSVAHFHCSFASCINSCCHSVVGSCQYQMFGKVRPALCMVVLAATTAERIHRKERATIVNARMMILRITDGMVRTSDITQCLEVRHHGSRIRVERYFFAVFRPHGISCHTKHDFIGSHLFYQAAGFHSLSGIDISQTSIFICTEHTSGNLSKSTPYQMMDIIRGFQHR